MSHYHNLGYNSRLERTSSQGANKLSHVERLGLCEGSRLSNLSDRAKDGLEKGGSSCGSGSGRVDVEESASNTRELALVVRVVVGVGGTNTLADHLNESVSLAGSRSGGRWQLRGRVTSGTSSSTIIDINEDTDNSDLGILTLPDHVHLHSHALSGVQMLTGQVEVELLESEAGVGEFHGTLSSNDFDSGAQVLEFGSLEHVRDRQAQLRCRDNGIGACGHVDGGLVYTC